MQTLRLLVLLFYILLFSFLLSFLPFFLLSFYCFFLSFVLFLLLFFIAWSWSSPHSLFFPSFFCSFNNSYCPSPWHAFCFSYFLIFFLVKYRHIPCRVSLLTSEINNKVIVTYMHMYTLCFPWGQQRPTSMYVVSVYSLFFKEIFSFSHTEIKLPQNMAKGYAEKKWAKRQWTRYRKIRPKSIMVSGDLKIYEQISSVTTMTSQPEKFRPHFSCLGSIPAYHRPHPINVFSRDHKAPEAPTELSAVLIPAFRAPGQGGKGGNTDRWTITGVNEKDAEHDPCDLTPCRHRYSLTVGDLQAGTAGEANSVRVAVG